MNEPIKQKTEKVCFDEFSKIANPNTTGGMPQSFNKQVYSSSNNLNQTPNSALYNMSSYPHQSGVGYPHQSGVGYPHQSGGYGGMPHVTMNINMNMQPMFMNINMSGNSQQQPFQQSPAQQHPPQISLSDPISLNVK